MIYLNQPKDWIIPPLILISKLLSWTAQLQREEEETFPLIVKLGSRNVKQNFCQIVWNVSLKIITNTK